MASAAPVAAEAFLDMPLACTLGRDCVIEDYMDADPGPGSADYTCGLKARDGHGGTDFALLSFEAMEDGIGVLAAASGTVAAVRDGVPDMPVSGAAVAEGRVDGVECGNGVRLSHDNGFSTLYCHMKVNSVAVMPGDRVSRGQRLGEVGLSGLTNYPHLHLAVLRGETRIDPFSADPDAACGTDAATLWRSPPAYVPAGLFTAGFSTAVPEFEAVRSGTARASTAAPDAPLVLYGHAFHAQTGDVLAMSATGPEGEIFATDLTIEDGQAQLFRAYGRRAPRAGWPEGAYRGYVRHLRDGRVLAVRHADIEVTR